MNKMRKHQSGNVVVFILLAVGLFGALAFSFTKSGQQGQGNMNEQQAKIAAQEMLQGAAVLQRAFERLRQRGCSESQIDFGNSVWQHNNGSPTTVNNTTAPGDGSCGMFTSNGGQATPPTFPAGTTNASTAPTLQKAGHPYVRRVTIAGQGSGSLPELLLVVSSLDPALCKAINLIANGQDTLPTIGEDKTGWNSAAYWTNAVTATTIGDDDTNLAGKTTFCWRMMPEDIYAFGSVILTR